MVPLTLLANVHWQAGSCAHDPAVGRLSQAWRQTKFVVSHLQLVLASQAAAVVMTRQLCWQTWKAGDHMQLLSPLQVSDVL